MLFYFNDPATTEISTLSLLDALPISRRRPLSRSGCYPPRRPRKRRRSLSSETLRRPAEEGVRETPTVYHIPVCPFSQRLETPLALKGLNGRVAFHVVDITRPRPEWLLEKTRGTT